MPAKSTAQFLITVTSAKLGSVGFTEMTGGDLSRVVTPYPDPQLDQSSYVLGIAVYSPIVLSVPYDPKVHDKFIVALRTFCVGSDNIQVTVQPIDTCPEITPDGVPRIYSNCLPSAINFPAVKREGATVSMLQITLNPPTMKMS